MTLRVTRQYGEVLGTGGGEARLARQYVEVLAETASVFEESLTSNMALTQDGHVNEQPVYATSNMALTHNATGKLNLTESLSSTINFTQVLSRTQELSLSSNMSLASQGLEVLGIGESAVLSSTLNFTQEVVTSGLLQVTDSQMNLTQTVGVVAPHYLFVTSVMNLNSDAAYPNSEKNLSASHEILFQHWAGRPFEESVTSNITFTQEAYRSETPTSTLNLAQSTNYGKTRGLEVGAIDFQQNVVLAADWSRSITQDLDIGHSLTYHVVDPCGKKSYTPYIGESTASGNPTPPDSEEPFVQGLPAGERFQFLYPGIGAPTDTVELRAPNLDNRERLGFTRINRETRGGKLIVFADPTWPQVNTLVLSFSGLKKTEVDDLQDFLKNYLGKEVGLIDWEGRQWVGIITTPTESAVQDSGGACGRSWTIGLEFEGVLLEEMPSGSTLNLTSSVVAVLA